MLLFYFYLFPIFIFVVLFFSRMFVNPIVVFVTGRWRSDQGGSLPSAMRRNRRRTRLVSVPRLLLDILGAEAVAVWVHGRVVSSVTMTRICQLVRMSMLGQTTRFVIQTALVSTTESAPETPLSSSQAEKEAFLGSRTKHLLVATMADKSHFRGHGEDEEENGNDGYRHTGRLQPTGSVEAWQRREAARRRRRVTRWSAAKGRVDIAAASAGAVPVHDGNIHEASGEAEVQDHGDKGGEGEPGHAAEEDESEEGVQGGSTRDARDGTDARVSLEVVVMQGRQKVGEDAENDDGAEELDASEEPLQ